jgi:hypothetical protein
VHHKEGRDQIAGGKLGFPHQAPECVRPASATGAHDGLGNHDNGPG